MRPGECRFERDMCDWSNGTDKSPASWRMATVNRRPSNLPDKTFGAPGSKIYSIMCCLLISKVINLSGGAIGAYIKISGGKVVTSPHKINMIL